MRRTILSQGVILAGAAAFLAACDNEPVGVDLDASTDLVLAVEQATVQQWHHLPSEEQVEGQVWTAAQGSGNAEATWALAWSGTLAGEAARAQVGGRAGAGAALESEGRLLVARAAVELFGAGYAASVLESVQSALLSVEEVARSGRLPRDRAEALARARESLAAASGLRTVNPEASLAAALEASSHARGLAPKHAAAEAIALATELLVKARQVAGGAEEYQGLLAEAAGHLEEAQRHFNAENYRDALVSARQSAAISRRVIAAASNPGVRPGPTPKEAAKRAIEMATDLYQQAEAKVSDGGTPEQLAALAEVRSLLTRAQAAFDAGDYPEALRLAIQSAEISRRLLRTPVPRPDILSSVAEQTIRVALELHAQAEAKVGSGGTDIQKKWLAQARALLDQAQTAFAAKEYALAIRLANEAAGICRRILFSR